MDENQKIILFLSKKNEFLSRRVAELTESQNKTFQSFEEFKDLILKSDKLLAILKFQSDEKEKQISFLREKFRQVTEANKQSLIGAKKQLEDDAKILLLLKEENDTLKKQLPKGPTIPLEFVVPLKKQVDESGKLIVRLSSEIEHLQRELAEKKAVESRTASKMMQEAQKFSYEKDGLLKRKYDEWIEDKRKYELQISQLQKDIEALKKMPVKEGIPREEIFPIKKQLENSGNLIVRLNSELERLQKELAVKKSVDEGKILEVRKNYEVLIDKMKRELSAREENARKMLDRYVADNKRVIDDNRKLAAALRKLQEQSVLMNKREEELKKTDSESIAQLKTQAEKEHNGAKILAQQILKLNAEKDNLAKEIAMLNSELIKRTDFAKMASLKIKELDAKSKVLESHNRKLAEECKKLLEESTKFKEEAPKGFVRAKEFVNVFKPTQNEVNRIYEHEERDIKAMIKLGIQHGDTLESIKRSLINTGYTRDAVDRIIKEYS